MGLCAVPVSSTGGTNVMLYTCLVVIVSLVFSGDGFLSLYGIISIPILCDGSVPSLLNPLIRSECGSNGAVGRGMGLSSGMWSPLCGLYSSVGSDS